MINENLIFFNPEDLVKLTNGSWENDISNLEITDVGAFSKNVKKGYLVVITYPQDWKGVKVDTHNQIEAIIKKNPSAILVTKKWFEQNQDKYSIPMLVVENTFEALKKIALETRDRSKAKRVLITGTEGKTSTKYALNYLISKQKPSYAQETSANITVPILFSLSSMKKNTKFTIVEVSCPQPNRCTERSKIISPHIAIITNLNQSHMNTHGSIENLIKHKMESLNGLDENGICIINKNTDFFNEFEEKLKEEKPNLKYITYGNDNSCSAFIIEAKFENLGWNIKSYIDGEILAYRINKIQSYTPFGSLPILLTMKKLGLDIQQAAKDYESFDLYWDSMGTINKHKIDDGEFLFYDQHFSITETALKSAINDLKNIKVKGKKIAVISGELNSAEYAESVHKRIAQYLDDSDIDILYTVGEHMDITVNALKDLKKFKGHFFKIEQILDVILSNIKKDDLLFIKGMTKLNFRLLSEKVNDKFPKIKN